MKTRENFKTKTFPNQHERKAYFKIFVSQQYLHEE